LITADHLALVHAGQVLDGTADADGDVEVGADGHAGLAHMLVVRAPVHVGHGAAAGGGGVTQLFRQLFHRPQCSGPFMPRPALTTISASGRGMPSPALRTSFTVMRAAPRSPLYSSTVAVPETASDRDAEFGIRLITFTGWSLPPRLALYR
jgi:hypothetical protein